MAIERRPIDIKDGVPKLDVESHRLPREPYPGHPVDYPTCSAPSVDNIGCDAWKAKNKARCDTAGEGPYNVVFYNKHRVKTSCHCRHWMYKYRFQPQNEATDDPWIPCEDHIAKDPDDISKGVTVERYEIKIENVRLPYSIKQQDIKNKVQRRYLPSGNNGEQTEEPAGQGNVGSKGDGKGRTGAKGLDAGS